MKMTTTLGSLVVNPDNMNVLATGNQSIKNLYAAGEVISRANGNDTLSSMMNSWNLAFVYAAGASAAENAKNK